MMATVELHPSPLTEVVSHTSSMAAPVLITTCDMLIVLCQNTPTIFRWCCANDSRGRVSFQECPGQTAISSPSRSDAATSSLLKGPVVHCCGRMQQLHVGAGAYQRKPSVKRHGRLRIWHGVRGSKSLSTQSNICLDKPKKVVYNSHRTNFRHGCSIWMRSRPREGSRRFSAVIR